MTRPRTRPIRFALALSAGALAAATSAAVGSPAQAAETTCQGKPATIASDATPVTGTEGPDVISAGPATRRIDALGGDDTICFYAGASVSAGAGNDTLTATSTGNRYLITTVDLGPGDDSYTGTDGVDQVDSFTVSAADRAGADTISTGSGDDAVGSGTESEPNRDRIDLGAGDDSLGLTLPPGSDAAVVAGDGFDGISVQSATAGGRWTFDLSATGSVQRDGRQLVRLAGVDGATSALTSPAAVVVRGDGATQSFSLASSTPQLDVALGGGRDVLVLQQPVRSGDGGRIDLGGDKDDTLTVGDTHRVRVDLAKHVMTLGSGQGARYTVLRTHNVSASAPDVRVVGDNRDNVIGLVGCRQVARGGKGADRIVSANGIQDTGFNCAGEPAGSDVPSQLPRQGARIDGQRGKDVLSGSNRSGDVLIGGPGRDRADGRNGRDTCRAEVEKSCER